MNARDFCYWLQGWFELGGTATVALSSAQIVPIKAHMALVRKVAPEHDDLFVAWLEMRLRDVTALDLQETKEVRRLLNAHFKHDIDPQYPGDPKELQAIHDGQDIGSLAGYGPGMRC